MLALMLVLAVILHRQYYVEAEGAVVCSLPHPREWIRAFVGRDASTAGSVHLINKRPLNFVVFVKDGSHHHTRSRDHVNYVGVEV